MASVEDIDWIMRTDEGATARRIAERLGIKTDTVYKTLTRAGRVDLQLLLHAAASSGWNCGSTQCGQCGRRRSGRRRR